MTHRSGGNGRQQLGDAGVADADVDVDVGAIIRRLRRQRDLSLDDLARASGVSASFLSAVEREASDISVGRLAKVARAFGLDVPTLLGYFSRYGKPRFLSSAERIPIDRGPGIDFRHLRVPGVDFELVTVTIPPRTAFQDATAHPGIEILYVVAGEVVLVYDGVEYPMTAGETGVWSGMHVHTYRNDGDIAAQFIAVSTETIWDR
ncbi:MAG: helix-turn-helix domain-containing protein [Thermomicrobiales bacterium]